MWGGALVGGDGDPQGFTEEQRLGMCKATGTLGSKQGAVEVFYISDI